MGYNASLVYPERKRCAKCRNYFCWMVILGLFCSEDCAGKQPISRNPEDWPREHYSGDPRREKRDWLSMRRAEREARRRGGKQAYQCGYCWGYHIGSPDPNKSYPERPVKPL